MFVHATLIDALYFWPFLSLMLDSFVAFFNEGKVFVDAYL